MKTIELDGSLWTSSEDFYEAFLFEEARVGGTDVHLIVE
jgi:hypothetical protein